MPEASAFVSQCYVTIDGTPVPDEFMANLAEITVENSLHMPDVATVVLNDSSLQWIDSPLLAPGKALEISGRGTADRAKTRSVFDGEIVELEPEFGAAT